MQKKSIFTSLLMLQMVIILLKTCRVEPIASWSPYSLWAVLYVPLCIMIVSALILKVLNRKAVENQ